MTLNAFKDLLKHLGFAQTGEMYAKEIHGATLKIDFANTKIIYPENEGLKIHERQTCNFSSGENFVVFECVHRLLEKGYKPKHIELEPKFPLGHGPSGGRADILVRNNDDLENALLIIECKTAGSEFTKEQKKMESNGGQLFSYLQQDRNTEYLCLYCSDFTNSKVEYQSAIVKIIDRKEDIDAFKNGDEGIKLFRDAKTKKELFEVWKDTFNLYFHYNGIFEDDVNAYAIELKPLKKKNLRPLSEATKTFNTFMEILRHNNISDNANAFNRILSLLLCKIVDEEKTDDEILDFQVKEGEDAEAIQDRLQRLYAKGMREHLREKIVYFEDDKIKDIIKLYPKQTPIDEIEDIFKQIKYYTQNEFALKEVHNKDLFDLNARVLNEVIKLLQNFQFRYNKKQQILGDFFELLLNHGVKQSEGQFFTPVPIVRFILFSIGLDEIIQQKIAQNEKNFLPRILDYACGAGHFLTESIDELQHEIEAINETQATNKDIQKNLRKYKASTEWAKQYIFGIEKDYRLARTSQIACFLNGDGDANIVYGDGLENHENIDNKHLFDVIVSNPPYAIKSFRNYLQVNGEQYKIYDELTEKSNEIEALFVERATQLLRPGGIAAIILPSSLLQGGGIYIKARKILLENFEIKAITEFDNGTFGATGTTTVVLFLKKRSDNFRQDRFYIAEDLFNRVERKGNLEHIKSADLIKAYIAHLDIEESDYQSLLEKAATDAMRKSELWRGYEKKFKRTAKNQGQLYQKILAAEKEKFYFFMLSLNDSHQSQNVIVVNSGSKDVADHFRGYKFSNAKGREGIQLFDDAKLYDESNGRNPKKANSYILKNLWEEQQTVIDEDMQKHIKIVPLTNMLNFNRAEFDKAINTNPPKNITIKTKWELVKLGDIATTQYGHTANATNSGNVRYLRITDITEDGQLKSINKKYISPSNKIEKDFLLHEGDIVIARSGSIGRMFLCKNIEENLVFASYLVRLKIKQKALPEYVFAYHQTEHYWEQVNSLKTVLAQPNLNAEQMRQIKIPLPDKPMQKNIVKECESVDEETEKASRTIASNKQKIGQKMQKVLNIGYKRKRVSTLLQKLNHNHRIRIEEGEILTSGKTPVITQSAKNLISGYTNEEPVITDLPLVIFGDHTSTFKYVDFPFVRGADGTQVLKFNQDVVLTKYFYFLSGQIEIMNKDKYERHFKYLKDVLIPVPDINVQQKIVAEMEKLETQIIKAQAW